MPSDHIRERYRTWLANQQQASLSEELLRQSARSMQSMATSTSNASDLESFYLTTHTVYQNQYKTDEVQENLKIKSIKERLMKKLNDKDLLVLVQDVLENAISDMENDCVDEVYRLTQLRKKVQSHLSS